MDVSMSICCRELKKRDVVDSSGNKIGRINDMTFTFDGKLKLSQFILGGSAWEEFLEDIRVRPDRDPVFNGSLIERLGDTIELNTSRNDLKTTIDEDAIPSGEIRLSSLEKMNVIDENGVNVGKAVDIDFDVNGDVSLTVGGGFFEEALERIGLKADVDILVPGTVIDRIDKNIHLKVAKNELSTTMDRAMRAPEVKKARENHEAHKGVVKVKLFFRPM
ncbi:MAG: PRC-barrel domain-containing protein [Promethearchaeota archaeon]